MLTTEDRENILGWAYQWLRDAAWTNTQATYCDVEPVCCDDIAKVKFLINLIYRSTGVLDDDDIELLYQRLQCLIGLSTVTTCPANCFPCTPVEPPTPPSPECDCECTLDLGKCCDYEVNNIEIPQLSFCVTYDLSTLGWGDSGDFTQFILSAVYGIGDNHTFFNITEGVIGTSQPTTAQLIAKAEELFDDDGGRWTYVFDGNSLTICDTNFTAQEIVQISLAGAGYIPKPAITITSDFNTQTFITIQGELHNTTLEEKTYSFEVNIDGEWVDETENIVDNKWESIEDCRIITDWRIIDSDDNVIETGNVSAINCTYEETNTVCEWLQLHQTAIEELQNQPATGLTCETLGDCPTFQEVQTLASTAVQPESLATVAYTGSYNDLSGQPSIPSLAGYATEAWVALQGYITNVVTALGYTPENVANKSTNVNTDQASNTKYPSVKAVYDWATGLFQTASQVTTAIANKFQFFADLANTLVNTNTSNVVLGSVLIPANTVTNNNIIEVETFISRANGGVNPQHRLFINTANTFTGATQIASISVNTASLSSKGERTFICKTGSLRGFNFTAASAIDDNFTANAPSTASVDWTVDQYFLTVANNATGETTTHEATTVKVIK